MKKRLLWICIVLSLITSLLSPIAYASTSNCIEISDGTNQYTVTYDEDYWEYYVTVSSNAQTIYIKRDATGAPLAVYNSEHVGCAVDKASEEQFLASATWPYYDAETETFAIPITAFEESADYEDYTKKVFLGKNTDGDEWPLYLGFSGGGNSIPKLVSYSSTTLYLSDGQKTSFLLSGIFRDADGDTLSYKYSTTEDGNFTAFSGTSYEITGGADSQTLYFKANDGTDDSEDTFTLSIVAVDKTGLTAAIADAKKVEQDNYYSSNDRYNGTYDSSKKGFWNKFIAAQSSAESVSTSIYANQTAIGNTITELQSAQAALIPKTEVNATELYEFLSDYTKTEQGYDVKSQLPLKQADYPAARWQAFEDAMASGHALLDALYETDSETGAVTPSARNWGPNRPDENKPEDAITNETLASALTTIRTALSGLVSEDDLKSADDARSYIRKLNTMFPAAQQGSYTDASWEKFVAARDKANALLEKYPASTDIPNDAAASEIRTAYSNYYKAAYGLTESGEVTVHVTVNDNLGALYPQYALTDSKTATFDADIKLADGQHSLKAALNASPFSWASALKSSNAEKITERRLVYINGVIMQNDATTADITNTDICLRNGDEVTVLRVIEPVGSYYGWDTALTFGELTSYFWHLGFTTNASSLKPTEGTPFTVNVASSVGYFNDYTGVKKPTSDKEIIVYGPQNEDGTYPAPVRTGSYTNASGNAQVTLYEAGKYVLIAVDTAAMVKGSKYPNLAGGASMQITVSPASTDAMEKMRKEYLAKVSDALIEYDEEKLGEFYSQGQTACETARTAITSATTMKAIQDAYKTLTTTLDELLAQAQGGFNLTTFRQMLKVFPTAAEIAAGTKYPDSMKELAVTLKTQYENATTYQRNQLTVAEKKQYEAIQTLYGTDGSTLPAAGTATLKFTYQLPEAVGADALNFKTFTTSARNPAGLIVRGGKSVSIQWNTAVNYSFKYEDLTYSNVLNNVDIPQTAIIPGQSTFEWRVQLAAKYQDGYTISKCLLNGVELSADSLQMLGKEVYASNDVLLWKIKSGENVVTIVVEEKQIDEIDNIKQALTEKYATYQKAEYTSENWLKLASEYQKGLAEIGAAANKDVAEAAKTLAIAKMDAVPKRDSSTPGTVHVTIQNTTYDDAPSIFKGTFVDETVTITTDMTMMAAVLTALQKNDFTWKGTGGSVEGDGMDISYIAAISKEVEEAGTSTTYTLKAFDGGSESGWMGTLNDWFTNKGFDQFSVSDGDEICVMYTTNGYGEDIGGSWNNRSTALSTMTLTGGKLMPESLEKGTTSYLFVIPGSSAAVTVTYEAANKNYQARAYLNSYNVENARYKSGEVMSVIPGDIIYIGVGERPWPTMNTTGTLAVPTKYTIQVVQNGSASDVESLIQSLPDVGKITLANTRDVNIADGLYKSLDEETQKSIDAALVSKLTACKQKVDNLQAAKNVSDAINALPQSTKKLTIDDASAVKSAKAAYDALTDEQKQYLTQQEIKVIEAAAAAMVTIEIDHVEELIAALPDPKDVTVEHQLEIQQVQAAFNALTKDQQSKVTNASKLTAVLDALNDLLSAGGYKDYLENLLAYVQRKADVGAYPTIGSKFGEWAILAEARAYGKDSSAALTVWYNKYLGKLKDYVADKNGVLNSSDIDYTEYSRIVLALTSLGEDATAFTASNGRTYDLVKPLLDKSKTGTYIYQVSEQGTNGTAFALIAMDSAKYYDTTDGNAARDEWISLLLKQQIKTGNAAGAWSISGKQGAAPDVDMTAMIIQALAPYYNSDTKVKTSVTSGLAWLSSEFKASGTYGDSEKSAQVVVALSALKRNAATDEMFQYQGSSVLTDLLSYKDPDTDGFRHVKDDTVDQMASEQAAYALVAYERYTKGSNTLYDMSDAIQLASSDVKDVIKQINDIGTVDKASYTKITLARQNFDKLSKEDQAKVTNYDILTAAEAEYQTILREEQAAQYQKLKAHYDELLNDKNKKYGTAAKKKLLSILQKAQADINSAVSCERVTDIYEKAIADLDAVKPGDIEVTFRLIGALEATQDVDLTTDSYLPEYVTWVPTTTYSLQENATVYDLFTEAMSDAGLRYIGAESNYVSTIYAPSCLGGYALSEFTNGARSGWMYTVNGSHPNKGLQKWTLKDGDVVVWHYVNDYSHEVADWFNDPKYPSLGNGTYYNGWLRAADISPEQYVNELLGKILKVGKNGTVEPKLTFQHIGKSVTFTFKPDTGYKVKDVKVNGKSVGAVKTYTIDKLTVSTRIEVEFTDGKLPFTDVHETDWFYNDVLFVYEEGLFAGTSDTTFSPNAAMTRAMLVTVLYRLEGEPVVSGRSGFSDVTFNSYYEDAVTWAADNSIVNGTSTTTFSPNANVTREQMAAILYRYAQYKKYNTAASSSLNGFTDYATVSGYAVTPMQWSVAEKLVNGSNGKLMPTGNASRAQVAAILHRFAENVAKTTK